MKFEIKVILKNSKNILIIKSSNAVKNYSNLCAIITMSEFLRLYR